jgi:hypothetical protein
MELPEYFRMRALFALLVSAAAILGLAVFLGPDLTVAAVAFLLAQLAMPLIPYLIGVRTFPGSLWTGVALIVLVLLTQVYVMDRWSLGSSTAGLGYLNIPFFGLLIVVATLVIEESTRAGY